MILPLLVAIALQPPGAYHAGEVTARNNEAWLALRVADDEATLVPTRLKLQKVADEVMGETGDVKTADEVSSDVRDVAMYLRGTALAAGRVPMGRIAQPDETKPEFTVAFDGRDYRIAPRCRAVGVREGQQQLACEWRLTSGSREQVLVRMPGYVTQHGREALGDDAAPSVLFAGDLDHDGRLDLILDITDHYNVSRPTLFLSKDAEGDAFVKQAAQFVSVGC